MDDLVYAAIRRHAEQEFPRESCGVVIIRHGRYRYLACRNVATDDSHFEIHAEDFADASDIGEITAIVHSHPNTPPLPSEADLVGCERSGLPWIIVNWPTGAIHQFAPTGHRAPLVGRPYTHGILDCYALVRDYYKTICGIELLDYDRVDEWWLKGQNLYEENFRANGFEVVTDAVRLHDIFLMQVFSPVTNHAAVYVGDGMILQHCTNLLSSRDTYGGYWRKVTSKRVRHISLA